MDCTQRHKHRGRSACALFGTKFRWKLASCMCYTTQDWLIWLAASLYGFLSNPFYKYLSFHRQSSVISCWISCASTRTLLTAVYQSISSGYPVAGLSPTIMMSSLIPSTYFEYRWASNAHFTLILVTPIIYLFSKNRKQTAIKQSRIFWMMYGSSSPIQRPFIHPQQTNTKQLSL